MRVLFLSGTSVGGAARSTHELAALLAARGHTVRTLMRSESAPFTTYIHRRAVNLRVKLGTGRAAATVDRLVRRLGRRTRPEAARRPYPAATAVRPENALGAIVAEMRPDVVVVNSIDLPAWRQVRADLRDLGVPVALYLREETGLLHLSHSNVPPDLLLANATGHAEQARALGHDATVIPSVVDCAACRVDSTRERVLVVNPVPEQGVDIALAVAAARPDIPFAFAESWPIEPRAWDELAAHAARLGNVAVRRHVDDVRAVFADARILLAPYRYPGRSRAIAEAHCNGLPVVASDRYGVAEAVGDGGVLVDPDGPVDDWVAALATLWDDPAAYTRASQAALAHSRRPEMQPARVAERFEQALATMPGVGVVAPPAAAGPVTTAPAPSSTTAPTTEPRSR